MAKELNCQRPWKDAEGFRKWHSTDWKTSYKEMGIITPADIKQGNEIFYHGIRNTSLLPKAKEIIHQLHHQQQKTMAIISMCDKPTIENKLNSHSQYFQIILGFDELNQLPSPAKHHGIIQALKHIKAQPEDACYICDDIYDVTSAAKVGLHKIVGVSWGLKSKELLLEAGADIVLDNINQLLEL